MAAEAAKAAFAVVKEALADVPQETKGKVILATVKGDIHDIGKNIVKVLLENYGYQAVDLGRDVDPETIVETAVKDDIRLVGLSALMTTTVVNMEETIRLLREKKPDCRWGRHDQAIRRFHRCQLLRKRRHEHRSLRRRTFGTGIDIGSVKT